MPDGVKEFDSVKLKAALQNGLNLNDCKPEDFADLLVDDDKDESIQEFADKRSNEISDDISEGDQAYSLSALGAKRIICGVEFESVIGNLVLLNLIDSPFINGELTEELEFEDIVQTLYVLWAGEDALAPIMAISQRIEDMYILKSVCKDNPAMCDKVIEKVEKISNSRVEFITSAVKFYTDNFTGDQLQEVTDGIFLIINEIMSSFEELEPTKSADEEKKNPKKKS